MPNYVVLAGALIGAVVSLVGALLNRRRPIRANPQNNARMREEHAERWRQQDEEVERWHLEEQRRAEEHERVMNARQEEMLRRMREMRGDSDLD